MSHPRFDSRAAPFEAAMRRVGMPDTAIAAFRLHLERYLEGETGMLGRSDIEPVSRVPDADQLLGRTAADSMRATVVIKLNGGLGTSMGLERAKSLIEVRPGVTFLDLLARQVLALRRRSQRPIPLLLMNSFRTDADTTEALAKYPELGKTGLPLGFLQHRVPKVLIDENAPAEWPADPELAWCPPGHGDLYTALATSGVLQRLLDAGYEIAFVSNSDNLGAVLDPALLDFMTRSEADFMMEVADRTPADRKGGHLCRLSSGRLALRESAQCPPDEVGEFQDIHRHRYFNTNNIWFRLSALHDLLERYGGALPLHTIVNQKRLDPRDPSSPRVVQLETAMGAAISLFDRAVAARVPRSRFSPVKNTNDLLGVRSDAFELTADGQVVLAPQRETPPTIDLDSRFYRLIEDFEARFPAGPPSLIRCTDLKVRGDVTFGAAVAAEGEVTVVGPDGPTRIPDGAVLRSEHRA
jgi:UTP--glucose-1-phosphate uridylyltransferase